MNILETISFNEDLLIGDSNIHVDIGFLYMVSIIQRLHGQHSDQGILDEIAILEIDRLGNAVEVKGSAATQK